MATPTSINLNDSTPAAPTGAVNVGWQASTAHLDPNAPPNLVRDVSAYMPLMAGDVGSGGESGAVPAPGAGDAAAGKFLAADGTWEVPAGGPGGSFTAGGDLSGTSSSQEVVGIQSKPIDGGPTDGDSLVYSAGSGKWEPTALAPIASPNFTGQVSIGFSGGGCLLNVRAGGTWTGVGTTACSIGSGTADNTTAALEVRNSAGTDLLIIYGDASASFSGVVTFSSSPVAPTPSPGDNSTKVATTAFVAAAVAAAQALVIGFVMGSGATGTNMGPMLAAPRAGTVSKCVVVTKSSDPSAALGFRIKQNGVDVFSSDPTVAAGTSAGTLNTFTALTSAPLSVAAGDIFSIDVTAGNPNWQFSAQLET
jgi:hypothetical protein